MRLLKWLLNLLFGKKQKRKGGYVYVLSNPAMPNLYKIGMTTKTPQERSKQLYSTGVPAEFKIELYVTSKNPLALEQAIHKELKSYRYNARREFFKCDIKRITSAIKHSHIK